MYNTWERRVEFNICKNPTRKRNTGPPRKRRAGQFLEGSWWSQVFYIEIFQEERDKEREKCVCVCVCVAAIVLRWRVRFCIRNHTFYHNKVLLSTCCIYLCPWRWIFDLTGHLHTYLLTLMLFDMVASLNFLTLLPLLCLLWNFICRDCLITSYANYWTEGFMK